MAKNRRTGTGKGIEWPEPERRAPQRYVPKGRIRQVGGSDPIAMFMAMAPPDLSEPERIVFGWLKYHDILFDYQFPLQGGRAVAGGLVVDFVIWDTSPYTVISVMSWWHRQPETREIDRVQQTIIENLGFRYETIWEEDIRDYERLDARMREILYHQRVGLGAPPAVGGALRPPEIPPCCDDPSHWRWYWENRR